MLACGTPFPLDGQAYMSKQGGSPDYECMRRLRECEARSNRLSRIKVPGAELGQTEFVRVFAGVYFVQRGQNLRKFPCRCPKCTYLAGEMVVFST